MAEERFLVTGAFGCIGAWATKRLLAEGASVWTYDLPGNPHRLKLIMDDATFAKINIVPGDITEFETFFNTVKDNGITHILHLAALQVPFVRANPVLGMDVNVVGTTIVLETAKQLAEQVHGVAYASSVAVYGPTHLYPPGPLQHDAPFLPATLYGVSKQANEWTAKVYWGDYKLRSVGLRPFFVYGPGRDQGASSVPTKAMLAAAAGRPYHINIGGTALFQHADDVAAALITAARSTVEGAPCFNLGGTKASIADVVAAIEAAAPEMTGQITYDTAQIPVPEDVDGAPAEAALGKLNWRPFKQGVADTIADFKTAIAANKVDIDRILA
jgi:nucleoside-diphosphate-sugar epimerase